VYHTPSVRFKADKFLCVFPRQTGDLQVRTPAAEHSCKVPSWLVLKHLYSSPNMRSAPVLSSMLEGECACNSVAQFKYMRAPVPDCCLECCR
jgi:hypothetical protein